MADEGEDRQLRKRKREVSPVSISGKFPLTPAERSKRWRKKMLKSDKADEYRRDQRENSKAWRQKKKQTRTQEELDKQRKLGRERAKRYRDNHQKDDTIKRKTLTRKQVAELRKYNRIKQREFRQRKSQREIEQVKHYDRERKHKAAEFQKRIKMRRKRYSTYENSTGLVCSFFSEAAVRQQSTRVRKCLPKSPSKYARVLNHVLAQAKRSPRKRLFLDKGKENQQPLTGKRTQEGHKVVKKFKSLHKKLPERRAYIRHITAQYKSRRECSRLLGIRWKLLQKLCSITSLAKDEQREEENQKVRDFYCRHDVSITLPDRKSVGKLYMNRSIHSAWQMYKQEQEAVIEEEQEAAQQQDASNAPPYSTFAKGRPKCVKKLAQTPQRQCICEVCANFGLALYAITKCGLSAVTSTDERTAVNKSMCARIGKFNKLECVTRACSACGTKKVCDDVTKDHNYSPTKSANWSRWVYVPGKTGRKLILATVNGTLQQLLEIYIGDLETMSQHLFHADWQYHQFLQLKKNIETSMVIQVLDFAQNYLCIYQDEPQGCHWDHNQVTIHPIVCYYIGSCGHEITEELVFLSNDGSHDLAAVNHFTKMVETHLEDKLHIETIVQFTDQCAKHYKSRLVFQHIANSKVKLVRHYFGSRHGKGPSDGVTGRVKQQVRDAVKARKAEVNDARAMYNYCRANMETVTGPNLCDHHHQMHFFIVENIDRSSPQPEVKQIVDTRKLHAVQSCGEPDTVLVRNLSCVCKSCMSGIGACTNEAWVRPWRRESLVKGKGKPRQAPTATKKKKVPTATLR